MLGFKKLIKKLNLMGVVGGSFHDNMQIRYR